jgi:ATP-dependent Lhr-like helicase
MLKERDRTVMQAFQFHPVVTGWFAEKFGSPTEPQQRGWPAIQSGAHTLIAAPTGSGKTLAAFFASLDALFREGLAGNLRDETRVVYVSPLKALSNDIHKNLEEPLAGIRAALLASEGRDVAVRAEVRTGDTPASKRQAIARKPPHILVTTPESFYLLLTSESGRKMFSTVRTLIVDEIHAVVGNRRGSHLALSMERLARLVNGPLQRIGLSATQKPIEEVARFLVGARGLDEVARHSNVASLGAVHGQECPCYGHARCAIIDAGYARKLDLAIELPSSPLEAVMSHEVWSEVYGRLGELIDEHRTTLVFVNTRRMAERVTHQLSERLGKERVTSHHGSLSAKLRLEAENRLKGGELKALVATASLELGIDIGSVDLVCQLGTTRSIATLLQRVGRAEHKRGGLPKGRLFPLSRDELVECAAMLLSVRRGELDALVMPEKPLDVLAQQMVASAACEDLTEQELFELMRSAYPYRELTRVEFDDVLRMLAEGFSTKRGRRGALIHHDAINHRVRGRRGARLLALTAGGAIADNADYRVVLEPTETFIGTVNEDFAIESMAGDIFQLGNASWKVLRVNSGTVRVEDAHGQPPSIPFWLGEAPGRTVELSRAVSDFRGEIEERLTEERERLGRDASPYPGASGANLAAWLTSKTELPESGARQLADYFAAAYKTLGVIPSQKKLVLERFFDESGGMQLVLHSPFGIRVNRAWGLALRKRFCRSFNFELQAAATDDAIVLSLGTQHSFPLDDVFRYLNSKTVRELLVQALLDAPMFGIHWRWNASRALALPRQRNGHRVPAPLQRMESENLLAAVFPDQLACLENIAGDREVPNHPLVHQTIEDCLGEVMDVDGLIAVLEKIETGAVECIARDLPEPSPLAHEILNAKPYAFLDDAPLEERRTHAVYTRRANESSPDAGLGILDAAGIETVVVEAWPGAANADELHEALLLMGTMTDEEVRRVAEEAPVWLDQLASEKRVTRFTSAPAFWVAAERLPMAQAIYPGRDMEPRVVAPEFEAKRAWEREDAIRELVRGRMEVIGPTTTAALANFYQLPQPQIEAALLALEAEGFILRGKFHPDAQEREWCDRRLLSRIHRLTINRLRAEIQPVSIAEFQRFLLAWQRVDAEHRMEGPEGVEAVLELLDGYELAAAAWEPEVLAARVNNYDPRWLDQLCFTGRVGWGRLSPPQNPRPFAPVRSSPVSIFTRENLPHWLALSGRPPTGSRRHSRQPVCVTEGPEESSSQREELHQELSPDTAQTLETLSMGGAMFFDEAVRRTGLLPSRVEQALGELVAQGRVTADSFEGLRALLVPQEKRGSAGTPRPTTMGVHRRRQKAVTSVEFAGRWSLLRDFAGTEGGSAGGFALPESDGSQDRDEATEVFARALLRRYGVVFRRMIERESLSVSWFELGRVYRRLEARGEIRGGHFVSGVSGEQFALPEAIGLLRSIRKSPPKGELIAISGADPLNLVGILTPGRRVAAIAANRILLRDGLPIAALEAGETITLEREAGESERATEEDATLECRATIERALRIGSMPVGLRPYYG